MMNNPILSVFPRYLLQRWIILVFIVFFALLIVLKVTERWPSFEAVHTTSFPPGALDRTLQTSVVNDLVLKTVRDEKLDSNFTSKAQVMIHMAPGQVVPKIVHFCWYGGIGKMAKMNFRFHHYIGLLAVHKHIKPDKIMFWYEKEPVGDLWKEINSEVTNIEMVYRKQPTSIMGKSVRIPEHQSDVVRLEAVIKYGGIYLDLDVIALKSFDPLLKYDVTMGLQSDDGLCNGAIIAKPGAEFLKIWHAEYKTFSDKVWAYHSVYLPFKLYEKHKDLVHVEETTIHRPSWFERQWIYDEGKLYDWSKNYAMHLWYRKYNKDLTPDSIRKLNTTLGQIFRYIYYGSRDLM